MVQPTNKQVKALEKAEKAVADKRSAYLSAYDKEKTATGVAVVLKEGSLLKQLWDELTALREERNRLLDEFRASGVNI